MDVDLIKQTQAISMVGTLHVANGEGSAFLFIRGYSPNGKSVMRYNHLCKVSLYIKSHRSWCNRRYKVESKFDFRLPCLKSNNRVDEQIAGSARMAAYIEEQRDLATRVEQVLTIGPTKLDEDLKW